MSWPEHDRRAPSVEASSAEAVLLRLDRLEDELSAVRNEQESNFKFVKRVSGVVALAFGLTVTYFAWVTRTSLIAERDLPRLEATMHAHMDSGGHNGTNVQLAEIKVEIRHLRDTLLDISKAQVDLGRRR